MTGSRPAALHAKDVVETCSAPARPPASPSASPAATVPAFDLGNARHRTVYIVAKDDDRGLSMIPREASEALDALGAKHPEGLRKLPTSEMGGGIFESAVVYKVEPGLLLEVEAVVAAHPELALTSLGQVLRPTAAVPPYRDSTLDALKGPASPTKTLALRSVHAALTGDAADTVPEDAATRDAIGDAVFEAVGDYVNLFNATLLEASRERREELLPEEKERASKQHGSGCGCSTCGEISKAFSAYFGASSRAIDELRKAGGTADLLAARDLVLMSAEVLENLGTPRSEGLLLQVLLQGDGVILASLAQRPEAVKASIDAALSIARTRVDQTAVALKRNDDERPEGWRGSMHGGGHENLPGHLNTVNGYEWTNDYPFEEVPTQPLTFLGTEHAGIVREALTTFLVDADRDLPSLLELHQAQHVAKALGRNAAAIEHFLESEPEAERAAKRKAWLGDLEAQALNSYGEYDRLTGQLDVAKLVGSLSWYGFANEEVYSESRAFQETAGLLSDVLSKVKTPQMHRLLADTALSTLKRYEAREKKSAEADAAAEALRQRLVTPGPDAEVHILVASQLATKGGQADLALLEQGLKHPNDDVQGSAMGAVTAMLGAGRSGELKPLAGTLETLVTDGVSVWTRLEAARALGSFDAGNAKALALAKALFAPEVSTERTGAKWTSPKNHTMRREAAKALAAHSSKAAFALPELDAAVQVAEKAKTARGVLDERRKAAAKAKQPFDVVSDPPTLAAVREALRAAAWSQEGSGRLENSAARVLRYLGNPNAEEFAKLPSYSSDRPNPEGVLAELMQIGEAAAEAAATIRSADLP